MLRMGAWRLYQKRGRAHRHQEQVQDAMFFERSVGEVEGECMIIYRMSIRECCYYHTAAPMSARDREPTQGRGGV